jgi:2-polyprenyl-3-methyl-5-hydroxy-6-metoxy-1,4-benzoquinol methylase
MNLDHFGFLAPFYEKFIKPTSPEKLLTLLQLETGNRILDAGGGTGRLSQFLKQGGNTVLVLDSSFTMLQEASKKTGLNQVYAATEDIPFSPASFDRIILVDALHHVADQTRTLLELITLLKPGGILIVEEPDIRKFVVKLIAIGEKILLMRSHFLTMDEIIALCKKQGVVVRSASQAHTIWVTVEKES